MQWDNTHHVDKDVLKYKNYDSLNCLMLILSVYVHIVTQQLVFLQTSFDKLYLCLVLWLPGMYNIYFWNCLYFYHIQITQFYITVAKKYK